MNNKYITYSLIAFLILFILYASIKLFVEPKYDNPSVDIDINRTISVNGKDLKVIFDDGDNVDIHLTYGNIYTKEITITNNNDEDVIYSLKLSDSEISNNELYYDIYIQYNNEYEKVINDSLLTKDLTLVYNQSIGKKSTSKIKVVFKTKHENEESIIKGKITISDNINSLELFNLTIRNITEAVDSKITKLNGISTKGYYLIDVNNLSFVNDANIKGYVLIDASDISNIKYVYTVYNDKYMVKNSDLMNLSVVNVDNDYINTLNNNTVCYQYNSRITCGTNIPKSNNNEKNLFYSKSKDVLSLFMKEFNKDDDKVYIYDINTDLSNSYGLTGYILKDKNNMFLYIRNDIFMISGYNYSKLGDYDIKSTTIRSYVESAFELSAKDKYTVCSFSGYDECYDKNNNLIGE